MYIFKVVFGPSILNFVYNMKGGQECIRLRVYGHFGVVQACIIHEYECIGHLLNAINLFLIYTQIWSVVT